MIIVTDYKGFKLVLKQISAQNWSIFCTKQIKNDKLFLMQPENPIKFMLITVWTAFSKKIGWTQNRKFTKSLFFKKIESITVQYNTVHTECTIASE